MVSWIFQKVTKDFANETPATEGLRLLAGLLVWLAAIGFWAVPAAAFALNLVLSGSVALIFLRAYQGTFPEVCDLFSPFRLEQLPHLVGGMAWMSLWVFLWTLIPVAGLVLGPVKLYTYRLTPYILMTRPDVKATRGHPGFRPGDQGVSRKDVFGRFADLWKLGLGSSPASWAGTNSFPACPVLRFIGSRSGAGRRPDAPGGRSCPGWLL